MDSAASELRLVLAVSLDGRLAPPRGGAAQLGGPGDRQVLEEALAWADASLIGAGTLRAHRCTCLIRDAHLLNQRALQERSAQPVAVVVSRQCNFSTDWPFFQQPLHRVLLGPKPAQSGFEGWVEHRSSWTASLARLHQQGRSKVVVLGGAHLTTSLLAADCIDELQLTLTPRLLGGNHCWLPVETPFATTLPQGLADSQAWALTESRPLGGDELLIRYRRLRRLGNH